MEDKKTKVIFSKALANKLVDAGFELLKTEINIKDARYRVFIFEETPELNAYVEEYKNEK